MSKRSVVNAPGKTSRSNVLYLVSGAIAVFVLFLFLQFRTPDICCGDFDGYYHIRWSRMLWEGLTSFRFPPQFRALPLTILSPHAYADQHLLFHLLLMPFTWFHKLVIGAKWAGAFFGSAAVVSCFWLLWRYRTRYVLLWLMALLASSSLFLERMSMTRAQSVSLIFIVVGMFLLFERRYAWLAITGFLYVWTYNLFIVLGVMVLIWMAIVGWSERRIELAPAGWTLLGFVAGFLVNPYFPRDLRLFWENVTAKSLNSPGAGSEWYALPSWSLVLSSFVALAAMALGYVGLGYLIATADKARLQRPLFLMVLGALLLIATTRSKRFLEYWPPIAVLFAAFTLQAVWDARSDGQRPAQADGGRRWLPLALVTLALVGSLSYQVRLATLEMQSPIPPDQYSAGAEWLRANVPAGEIVLNLNWDDFPKLFYYDPTRPYVSGLDPMYLADANPQLAKLYDEIKAGYLDNISREMASRFGARYIFAGRPLPGNFYVQVRMSDQLELVYQDPQCVILKVSDAGPDAD